MSAPRPPALDAFVLPSRAEGFGLCGLEAMASGLPTIATGWSGPADYLDPADSLALRFELVDAAATEANGVRYFGEWAEPDVDHLRSLLRWLYEHRDEAARMGRMAAARVHRDWTWDRVAARLRDDLDLLAGGVFYYPADSKDPKKPGGKLRLAYEAAPLAFLAEQAGGYASDGRRRILDIEPEGLHQRVPLFIGSRDLVKKAEQFIREYDGMPVRA